MNTSRQLTDLIKKKAHSLGLDAQLLLKRYNWNNQKHGGRSNAVFIK